jgi:hypothetical protein
VVQEIWAKISARERLIVYGAVAVLVGWIVGEFIATISPCAGTGFNCGTYSYFTAGNAGLFALLGLVGAVVAVVILYLKVAPNMNIAWPLPVAALLFYICAATVICGVLVVLMQVSYGLGAAPVTMWIADVIFVGGGAAMAYISYQEWLAAGKPTK